ncbi:hypothetical protein BH11PAT2_BH11PAT2_05060 [soil metagenome]
MADFVLRSAVLFRDLVLDVLLTQQPATVGGRADGICEPIGHSDQSIITAVTTGDGARAERCALHGGHDLLNHRAFVAGEPGGALLPSLRNCMIDAVDRDGRLGGRVDRILRAGDDRRNCDGGGAKQ